MLRFLAAISVPLALVACQTTPAVEEAPTTAELQPMEQPATLNVGYTLVRSFNGSEEHQQEVIARDSTSITWKTSKGCEFKVPATGFAPFLSWKNCRGENGNQVVKLTTESPWPLSVGKTWTYAYSGGNTATTTWSGDRTCTVTSTVRVTAPIGSYDTFKITCNDDWSRATYYMSPELTAPVLFFFHVKDRNQTDRYELIRIENNNRGS